MFLILSDTVCGTGKMPPVPVGAFAAIKVREQINSQSGDKGGPGPSLSAKASLTQSGNYILSFRKHTLIIKLGL